jgi:chemotaxis protein MotA
MAEKAKQKAPGIRPDVASFGGIILALVGIVGGLILEGGSVKDITQVTAAIIVLGGTFGATLISCPLSVMMGGMRRLKSVFFEQPSSVEVVTAEIIGYATKARKNGLVSLEPEVEAIQNPFLKKSLTLAVDGTDLDEIRKIMDLAIGVEEQRAEAEAKVFESAGGYAPTIGIIGAVLGLIQVMKNLANIDEVGHGIAVAFVATVYGVGVSNLFLLPAATKIRARANQEIQMKELMLGGVIGIVECLNPKLLLQKLEAYSVPASKTSKGKGKAAAPAKAEAARPEAA